MPDQLDDAIAALKRPRRDTSDPLDTIAFYESGGRNIRQNVVPAGGGYNPSVGHVTGPSTASGPWQITNTTWRGNAPAAGVDVNQYPSAMSAPVDVQRRVAAHIFNQRGFQDWAPYNASLRAALRRGEGQGSAGNLQDPLGDAVQSLKQSTTEAQAADPLSEAVSQVKSPQPDIVT